jgi:prepilin-type N-terminal cleavage/methylation domain-containing protein
VLAPPRRARLPRRGFTLVELVVVILIVGVLAAVGIVAHDQVTSRAHRAAAQANLHQVTTAVIAAATDQGTDVITREMVLEVMSASSNGAVVDGLHGDGWVLGRADQSPALAGEFAVGFDHHDGQVTNDGVRAALVVATGDGDLLAQVFTTAGAGPVVPAEAGVTPEIVLGGTPGGSTSPVLSDGSITVPVPPVPAPAGVTADPGDGAVTVSWTPVPGATSYTVTATPLEGGAPVVRMAPAPPVEVDGLVNGATYLVAVTATVDARASQASDPVVVTPTVPASPVDPAKLLAADGASSDYFGYAVAIDGDTVVVGAYQDGDKGIGSGSAYVFTRTGGTWTQQAKLVPADGAAYDRFGSAVAVDADTIVVGAYGDDDKGTYSGSAYVFTRTGGTWTQQAKLVPADGAASDYFGYAVAVDADTIVVGAYKDDDKGSASGSAYVFTRTGGTWTQQAKLVPADGTAGDYFGFAVAVDADTIVVGAYGDDDKGADSGSAYVFTRTGATWTQQAKLTAPDGTANDYFGHAVAVDAGTIVVGAYGDDDKGDYSGSAYVFTRTGGTWTQQAKLVPADGAAYDDFGTAVAINANTIVVGAHKDDDKGTDSGSVYVFVRTGATWAQQAKLTAPDGTAGDWFGRAVAVDGDTIVVGAPYDDDKGDNSGSVWVLPTH